MAFLKMSLMVVLLAKTVMCMEQMCKYHNNEQMECNYLPSTMSDGINKVTTLFNDTGLDLNLDFDDSKWDNVTYLELLGDHLTECNLQGTVLKGNFSGLKTLNVLKIKTSCRMSIRPNVFVELSSLKTLDMSGCQRLKLEELIPTLDGEDKVPNLENLILSDAGSFLSASEINEKYALALKTKKLKLLNLSGVSLTMINVTAILNSLEYLEILNVSYAKINEIYRKGTKVNALQVLDMSYAILPARLMNTNMKGKIVIINQSLSWTREPKVNSLLPKAINISGVYPDLISMRVENSTVIANNKVQKVLKQIIVEELVARENKLNYLDLRMDCGNITLSSVRTLDLAWNDLEFIHPNILSFMPNIAKLDLSNNQLIRMIQGASSTFEIILTSLYNLVWIDLSGNSFESIPGELFRNNFKLESIDLSLNKLNQVIFRLSHLKSLNVLDLRFNDIQTLDSMSVSKVNSINLNSRHGTHFLGVLLQGNPLDCSNCRTKQFLQWLVNSELVQGTIKQITCLNEDGKEENVNKQTVTRVQKICERGVIIVSSSTAVGVICLVASIVALFFYIRRKNKQKMLKREHTLAQLREGNNQYEFVAFLSYSSGDEDFITNYVKDQLNENLKLMTDIDRNLICTGDEYLRIGFMVHNETIRCIERSSIVIAMVTEDYCRSVHCHSELDQAYRLHKPIILMLKEKVDVDLMTPTIRLLFRQNVRILWILENEEYVLKTSWKNVCTSILDLIAQNAY